MEYITENGACGIAPHSLVGTNYILPVQLDVTWSLFRNIVSENKID
ncbi:MAG: hypothetical protein ACXVIG_05590 [Halobacteriota archaeon]